MSNTPDVRAGTPGRAPRSRVARRARTALAALALGSLFAAPAAGAPDDLETLREKALVLVNEARAARDLPALEAREALAEAAQAHAEDMARRGYFAHEAPDGDTVRDRFLAAGGGRWKVVRENIAKCTNCEADRGRVAAFQEGWMESPGHRANILAEGLAGFGFGLAVEGDAVRAVQTFAGPGAAGGESGEPVAPEAAAERLLERVNEARAAAGLAPLEPAPALAEAARALADRAFEGGGEGDVLSLLPEGARGSWSALAAASAACGGCGRKIAEADAERFAGRLLEGSGGRLLSERFGHAGLALSASGEGRKTVAVLLGARR
jgi:uncharacterized protein YkwD